MAHAPISPDERIAALDVLRGFALLGILIANLPFYAQPIAAAILAEPGGGVDRVAALVVRFLVEAKFYSLFSLLFGIGLFVQMQRAESRGVPFGRLYARRLVALGAIGAAHAFLLWPGDILLTYAVLGFPLLLFRRQRPRTLLIAALVVLVAPVAVATILMIVASAAPPGPGDRAARVAELTARAAHAWQVYGHGSFLEVTRERVRDFALLVPSFVYMAPGMFAMFLVGLWVARRGLLHDVVANRRALGRIVAVSLPVGVVANVAMVLAREHGADPGWRLVMRVMHAIGAPALCIAYASGIALLLGSARWQRWLAPLGAAGRMPLSSYLLQSLIATTLFYGYGVGLLGRVGTAAGIAVALAIWLAQLSIATWWLRRFAYGPAEWLWRLLTYGRAPSMRRAR